MALPLLRGAGASLYILLQSCMSMKKEKIFMNIDAKNKVGKEDRPLTRRDVEIRLQAAGSSDKLKLLGANLRQVDLTDLNLAGADLSGADLSGADLGKINL